MYLGNPYSILGVDNGASEEVCRKAYRQLCRKLHPDVGGDPAEFDKVAKAYDAIVNKKVTVDLPRINGLRHRTLFNFNKV